MQIDKGRERELAATNDAALIRYQSRWERKIAALQRRYPERWRVPGWSEQEVRDALTLHLFERLRAGSVPSSSEAPDDDWELRLLGRHVRSLRNAHRLEAAPTDLSHATLLQSEASQEDRWLELEADACRALAASNASARLNHPQRRWLAALKWSATCGEFFESSARPNLSAAARVLDKNRSSAVRAFEELRHRFQSELERVE
jgi:hypothetical protein